MQKSSRRTLFFRFGKRLEIEALHPPGEGIGQAWNLEQVGGPREEEAPGSPAGIDTPFDGEGEFRHPLDLINGHPLR